ITAEVPAQGELGDLPRRSHPADEARLRPVCREPEVAVAPGTEVPRLRAHREHAALPARGDPPDLAGLGFREPEIAVRSGHDVEGHATLIARRQRKHRDVAVVRDPPDLSILEVGEPETTIGTGSDLTGPGGARGDGERSDLAGRGHPADSIV